MINYHGIGVLTSPSAGNHIVKVYRNAATRAQAVAHFIKKGVSKEEAVIIIAKPELRTAIADLMKKFGLDMQCLKEKGQIKFIDVEFLLSGVLVKGELHTQLFNKNIRTLIQAVKIRYVKVRVFGEMAEVLLQHGLHDKAMQLEDALDELSFLHQFSMLCTYSLDHLDLDHHDDLLERICKHHTHHVSVKEHDFIEPAIGKVAPHVFYAAWNRVMDKMKNSRQDHLSKQGI